MLEGSIKAKKDVIYGRPICLLEKNKREKRSEGLPRTTTE